jgi:hypothetical protein
MTTQGTAHDLVIRGGLVVDGTGAPGRRADVAVRDGKLSEIGAVTGRGAREVSAAGLVVAPGFIDPHTHYDAQITWDSLASCSSWHGVTTVVMGNCGFTLAPCRAEDRLTLMRMLTTWRACRSRRSPRASAGVGDPAQYQTGRAHRPVDERGLSSATGDPPVRDGRRAWESEATAEEIAAWSPPDRGDGPGRGGALVHHHQPQHVGDRGRPVPSRLAHEDDLTSLVRTMGASGRGIPEPDHRRHPPDRLAEVDRFAELARAGDRPVTLVRSPQPVAPGGASGDPRASRRRGRGPRSIPR